MEKSEGEALTLKDNPQVLILHIESEDLWN